MCVNGQYQFIGNKIAYAQKTAIIDKGRLFTSGGVDEYFGVRNHYRLLFILFSILFGLEN